MSQEEDHCWQTIQQIDNPWSSWYEKKSQTTTFSKLQMSNNSSQSVSSNAPKRDDESTQRSYPLSEEDKRRQTIVKENQEFISQNQSLVPPNGETIYDKDHNNIQRQISGRSGGRTCQIFVNSHSTIWSAIYCHNLHFKTIYVLNFANAFKPGGGYLNGRRAQEETLCRQTLLYPSLVNNEMYSFNSQFGREGSDVMIYSPNVLVIRDDNEFELLPEYERFYINVITSAAVDNSIEKVENCEEIMERRIRKIISLAAFKAMEDGGGGKVALILGAFGCGVYKNDPTVVASIFAKILFDEKMESFFDCVIFPIYRDSDEKKQIFQDILSK